MAISIVGKIYDGQTSTQYDVELELSEDGTISCSPELFSPIHIAKTSISSRVGNIPRTISLPSGMVFETETLKALDSYIEKHYKHIDRAHRLESKTGIALGAMLFLFIFALGSLFWGIPWASNTLAAILPANASTYIGQGTLESMDKVFFFESLLSKERQENLQNKFSILLPVDQEDLNYSLVFRQGGLIGANAFALPGGTIVMTDEMVELAQNDGELQSILLHEIGHIVHRHSLRQIISHSGLAVLTVMFTGDVVSAGTLMLALPNILMKSSFSRELEAEADEYSIAEMRRLGIQTDHFANIMYRLEQEYLESEEGEEELEFDNDWLEYFSTHPVTDDRIARFRTTDIQEQVNKLPIPELLSDIETQQGLDVFSLRAMLEQGSFEKLDEVLSTYQQDYEQGRASEITIELAYDYLAFSEPRYEALLDRWVDAVPAAYTAHLARARYYYNLSQTINDSYAPDESTERHATQVKEARDKAIADANLALAIQPSLGLAYSVLISIADAQDDEKLRQEYIDEALQAGPSSYIIRRDALYYLSPELGGSYAKISRFLVDTKKHLEKNPDLTLLMGYLYYVKSWDAYGSGQYLRTIRLTTTALKNRNYASYYEQRANSFYSMEAYEHALVDYTNAIKLNAYEAGLYVWRAYAYIELKQEDMALTDLRYAAQLFPYHFGVLMKLGDTSHDQGLYSQADKVYRTALIYNSDNPYLWYSIGRNVLFGMDKPGEALTPLKKAVDMAPDVGNYWYAYGTALAYLDDCDAVTALEKYLNLCRTDEEYDCYEDTRLWAQDTVNDMQGEQCHVQ